MQPRQARPHGGPGPGGVSTGAQAQVEPGKHQHRLAPHQTHGQGLGYHQATALGRRRQGRQAIGLRLQQRQGLGTVGFGE